MISYIRAIYFHYILHFNFTMQLPFFHSIKKNGRNSRKNISNLCNNKTERYQLNLQQIYFVDHRDQSSWNFDRFSKSGDDSEN